MDPFFDPELDLTVLDVVDDGELTNMELHDIVQSLDTREQADGCWGGLLANDLSRCTAMADHPPTAHFKHKLCEGCQRRSFCVPADRVRAIGPNEHTVFVNCAKTDVWTEKDLDGHLFAFRTINQTAKCRGDRLVIFRTAEEVPRGIGWAPLQQSLVRDGMIRLKLCKGTLVPHQPHSQAAAAVVSSDAASDAADAAPSTLSSCHGPNNNNKRSRSASDDPSTSSSPSATSPTAFAGVREDIPTMINQLGDGGFGSLAPAQPPLQFNTRGAASPAPAPFVALLASHHLFDEQISTAMMVAAERNDGTHGGGGELSLVQRRTLEELQGALRRSVSVLQDAPPHEVAGAAAGGESGAAAQSTSWLPLSWMSSYPPSPPGTGTSGGRGGGGGGGGESGDESVAGRWSSGLCACAKEPTSCLCVLLCWPVVSGQLGQKIVRTSWLCFCFCVPMLFFLLFLEVPLLKEIAILIPMRVEFFSSSNASSFSEFKDQARASTSEAHDLLAWRMRSRDWEEGDQNLEEGDHNWSIPRLFDLNRFVPLAFCNGIFLMWLFLLRSLVRRRDNIPGSPLRDCCVSMCCWYCGMCQLARHEYGKYQPRALLSPTGEKEDRVRTLVLAV